jgi:putative ABC transport system ATP-binding protein
VPSFSYAADRSENSSSRTPIALPQFALKSGEIVVLSGRSGCGKSTLLHLITGVLALARAQGSIRIATQELAGLSQGERDRLRPTVVGWMPQRVHLISALSVFDNVMLPILLGDARGAQDLHSLRLNASALLTAAGIGALAGSQPSSLSVGQASRACAARALIANPQLLCADEPSAALDRDSAKAIAAMIAKYVQGGGAAVIASHDRAFIDALDDAHIAVTEISMDAHDN